MKHLEVYNFGPIKEAVFDFQRINVIIGPQNAGKSTILKIACHCAWVEKQLMITKDVDSFQKDINFLDQLLRFHNLQGYDSNPNMRIMYNTTFLKMEYLHEDKSFTCKFTSQGVKYKRAKLSYIPAERNVITTIPNWDKLSFKDDTNILSFMRDWKESRKEFINLKLNIPSLGADYHFDEKENKDMVNLSNMNEALLLSKTSSGTQSLIPIILYVHYLTHSVFNDKSVSSARKVENEELMDKMYDTLRKASKNNGTKSEKQYKLTLNNQTLSFEFLEERDKFERQYRNCTQYQHSDIYIEEPEENLFPHTQVEVLYHLLKEVYSSQRENTLFITTHSPYILYGLNNAILANIVRKKIPKGDPLNKGAALTTFKVKDVRVWQIKDGILEGIQNDTSNTIQDKRGLITPKLF